jgi:phenylalanyl-tRNA synthetase beta chain
VGDLVRPSGADKALIAQARVFDVYQGARRAGRHEVGGPGGFDPAREPTLTEAEIEALSSRIVAAAPCSGRVG